MEIKTCHLEPLSAEDLLPSCGEWGQQTASSCQLLPGRPLWQRAPLPSHALPQDSPRVRLREAGNKGPGIWSQCRTLGRTGSICSKAPQRLGWDLWSPHLN